MKKKKSYIIPHVAFEDIEEGSPLCDVSVYAPGQDSGYNQDDPRAHAKAGDLCLDDEFIGPIEAANNSFEYSIDFDF